MRRLRFALVLAGSCTVASVAGAQAREPQAAVGAVPGAEAPEESLASPSVVPPERRPDSPNLLRLIGGDFRDFFTTTQHLVILGVGLGASLSVAPLDTRIMTSGFNSELYEGTTLDHIFEPGAVVGGALVQVGGALATYGIGALASNGGLEAIGRDLVRVQVVTQSTTKLVKHVVRRLRPDESNRRSYPSGHTSGTFATATVLHRHYGWRASLPGYGGAVYVAASRLSENKHYLSDVVFGAAVGIAAGRTLALSLGRARFEVAPALAPGGDGIQVTASRTW